MPPFPIYVIPYPLPIVPSPNTCPCYLLNPSNNSTQELPVQPGQSGHPGQPGQPGQGQYHQGHQQQFYQPYGIIGFVPVVFVPYCPGNAGNMVAAQQNFPNAVSVPYNCAECKHQSRDIFSYFGRWNGGRSVDFGDLKAITSPTELDHFLKNAVKPSKKVIRRLSGPIKPGDAKNARKGRVVDVSDNESKTKIQNQIEIKKLM